MYLFENVCFDLNDPISFWTVDHYDWNSKPDHVFYTSFHHKWIYQAHEYGGEFIREILRNVNHFHGLSAATGELTKEQCRDNPWNNFLPISERRELFSPTNILNKGYMVFAAGSRRKNPPSRDYNFFFYDINESAQRAAQRICMAFDFCLPVRSQ